MSNKVNKIILHHSAISRDKNKKQFKAINNYHKRLWNFKSSLGYYGGYHYLIEPSGRVHQYRAETDVGAHCSQEKMNFNSIGICLTGNFDIEKPTPNQIFALRDLLKKLVLKYKLNKKDIMFHNAYANKSCPGGSVDIDFVRSLVGNTTHSNDQDSEKNPKEKIQKLLEELTTLVKKL